VTGFERRAGAIRARVALFALFALLAFAFLPLALGAQPASASPASAHWSLVVESEPTYFNAGGASDEYVVIARNDGAAAAVQGAPIQLTDTLPAGVTVRAQAPHGGRSVTATGSSADENGQPRFEMSCPEEPSGGTVTCAYENGSTQSPVLPGAMIVMTLDVSVAEGTERLEGEDTATISGGGAPTASTGTSTTVASDPAPFGLSLFTLESVQEDGEQDAQAGSHPYELTAALAFAVAERESQSPEAPLAAAAPKDVEIALPRGLIGNPRAVPRCSQKAFQEAEHEACPLDTQVGILRSFFYGQLHAQTTPVYNLVPPPGVPAELGFSVGIGRIPLFLRVRGEDEYALTASLQDIPQSGPLQGVILTLWGVPAARVHDIEREGAEGGEGAEAEVCKPKTVNEGGTIELVGCPSGAAGTPFLTLPGSCQGSPPAVGVAYDSWERPLSPLEPFTGEAPIQPALTGCGLLSFAPSLTLTPEVTQAGAPSGYTLGLHVPQNEDPGALASAELRSAVVHLPAGLVLSPAFASDLRACSPQQFDARSTAAAACPAGSQLGTAKIATPLLARELEGQVFLGTPECASCGAADAQEGRLLRVLVQAQGEGVTIKLEGSVSIDQATGQLTVSFRESPELPVEDVSLTFAGGADAPLVNPASCGVALSATAQLIPYSDDGAIAEPTSAPFTLGGCQPSVFRPAFSAATTNNQAGAFSPLVLAVGRSDAEAPLSTLSVRLVPGLMGMLSRVAPCTAQQAQAAACTSQSLIGTVAINAGAGPAPVPLSGSVYLTGPYEGAPFGLSIIVPAKLGPFDLGEIAIRARVAVDPRTAALSITSDPLPQSLDGIPLQLRTATRRRSRARSPPPPAPRAQHPRASRPPTARRWRSSRSSPRSPTRTRAKPAVCTCT